MARNLETFDQLVNALYDAALHVEQWPAALQAVADSLGCEMFHSFVWDLTEQRPLVAWATPSPSTTAMHEAYDGYFGRIDPRRRIVTGLPVGHVFRCHDHIDEREVGASEFYQDFLLPNGLRYMVGVTLAREPGSEASLALLRARGRQPFSEDEAEWARRLSPHLQRAIALLLRHGRIAERLQAGEQALNSIETGILLLDERGEVTYANATALALFPRYFVSSSGTHRLKARSGHDAHALDAAWHRVVTDGSPQSMLMHDPNARSDAPRTVAVTFCRAPAAVEAEVVPRYKYLAFLVPQPRQRVPGARQLAALFDLTPAEARLAQALAAGRTLAEAAADVGVKPSTVRTQLLGILAKTGTMRQQDLVALLTRLPVNP